MDILSTLQKNAGVNRTTSYTAAFLVSTWIIVYMLHVPFWIAGNMNRTMVHHYYYTEIKLSLIFDFVLIAMYFMAAEWIIKRLSVRSLWKKIIVVLGTTIAISGSFCLYFLLQPMTSLFFSRWFHKVKGWAVLYDCILIAFTYLLYQIFMKLTKK